MLTKTCINIRLTLKVLPMFPSHHTLYTYIVDTGKFTGNGIFQSYGDCGNVSHWISVGNVGCVKNARFPGAKVPDELEAGVQLGDSREHKMNIHEALTVLSCSSPILQSNATWDPTRAEMLCGSGPPSKNGPKREFGR